MMFVVHLTAFMVKMGGSVSTIRRVFHAHSAAGSPGAICAPYWQE